jgi:2-polyprenyl-3-methyl-5-hydroxy-6-metoxy-1,4-benzoquinol methylase
MRCICCLSEKIESRPLDKREYLQCRRCGFVFKPSQKTQQPRRQIRNHYQFQDPHRRVADSKRLFFDFALNHLSRYGQEDKNLLDVGCGYGYFLEMAARRGWMVKGVEITRDAARRSRELLGEKNIFHGLLKEANFPADYFDAVTLWDVLVFVDDPYEDLAECFRIMKPRAAIGLRVRNVFFQKMVYRMYAPIKQLARLPATKTPYVFHPYCFSAGALEHVLRRAGFERIRITNSPLTHGDPYRHTRIRGAAQLAKTLVALLSDAIFRVSFGKWIMGPSLLAWARKPETSLQNAVQN